VILDLNRPLYLREDAFFSIQSLPENSMLQPPKSILRIEDNVAILDIFGALAERKSCLITYESIQKSILEAIQNPQISHIILNIDSPGGECSGVEELALCIYNNKSIKPIFACINNMAASAAYYIASPCTAIFNASSISLSGSIGVVEQHIDMSLLEKNMGVVTTEIYVGKYKRISSMHKPLTEEAKQYIEESLLRIYGVFVKDVSFYRNKDIQYTLENMADGRDFIGDDAIQFGLVDDTLPLANLITLLRGEKNMITNPFSKKVKAEEAPQPQEEPTTEEKMISTIKAMLSKETIKSIIKEVLAEEAPKEEPVKKEEMPAPQEPTVKSQEMPPSEEPKKEPSEALRKQLKEESVIPNKFPQQIGNLGAFESMILKKVTSSINPKLRSL
jgi:signal peptide peptidase SppA